MIIKPNKDMFPRPQTLFFFVLALSAALFFHSCEDPPPIGEDPSLINKDMVLMGKYEGMIFQEFDPPLEAFDYADPDGIVIYPDTTGEEYIRFYIDSWGPTGPLNFRRWVMISGSDSISFLYHYEEHMEYHDVWWEEYVYSGDVVEVDSVRTHMNSFLESESPVGPRGLNVLSSFEFGDTVFNLGGFSVGESINYMFDTRVEYSLETSPNSMWRITPDSSYVRNDTTIVFFTESNSSFIYNQDIYNSDGVYILFKLQEKGRERLGWMKITTTGIAVSVSCCAIHE